MKEKTVSELKQMRDEGVDFQLIDVREEHEFDMCNIEGELIPLGNLLTDIDKIRKDVPVIVHCRSGSRSAAAINELEKRFGYENLYNLKGGIMAYSKEIDPNIIVS
ncbi:MAG: rhodanese-like domain-containing protein [Bacteroidia bacterium]|nr:rhodanese-like domain-containing protein [Bacteroidia bacterium]MBP7244360.1 rhodanese-like domain-containing protein [Bacteroidia bacterium]